MISGKTSGDIYGTENEVTGVISTKLKKLRWNLLQFSQIYDFPGAHRTNNMVDRLMQRMGRHLFSTQYFHGTMKSANLSIRAWGLIQDIVPLNPWTVRQKDSGPKRTFRTKFYGSLTIYSMTAQLLRHKKAFRCDIQGSKVLNLSII